MGALRFADLRLRPTEVLDLTRLTVHECGRLGPPFEAAFHAHMARWRLDGKPRTARRYTTDPHGPLPTPEDRLWCLLVDLKTDPLQVVQGRLCGIGQSTAQQWIHVRLVVRRTTRRPLGDAPTRALTALAIRLGIAAAAAAAMVEPTGGPAPTSPLVGTTGPNGASSAPRIRLSTRAVIAARKRATRCKTCCGSMRRSRSSSCATPTRAAPTRSGWPMDPRIPCPRAAGGSKSSAFWRVCSRRSK